MVFYFVASVQAHRFAAVAAAATVANAAACKALHQQFERVSHGLVKLLPATTAVGR